MSEHGNDPMDFLRGVWGNMGFPMPGMMTPTLDVGELDKRIADLKAVEGWLKMNLNMLQMTIQGMELQRSTLAAVHAMGSAGAGTAAPDPGANPFTNPALWPWNFMQSAGTGASAPPESDPPESAPPHGGARG